MNELALFAGAGGGILGGKLLGWRTVCAVEIDAYARHVLLARQRDGVLDPFPIWDDVRTFDGNPWAGVIDVISGGFPCQDISAANPGGQGLDGERSGLWKEMARIVGQVRPRYVFVENSPRLLDRGIGRVLGDLAALGYLGCYGVLGGASAGMDSDGERLWILAKAPGERWEGILDRDQALHFGTGRESKPPVDADSPTPAERIARHEQSCGQPAILGESDGLPHRVDRLRVLGNSQFPDLAALAVRTLSSMIWN